MRNPNGKVLCIAIVLIVAVAVAGYLSAQRPDGALTDAMEATEAQAYLRVQVGSEVWPLIPMEEGGEYVVEQENGCRNVIHTTATGMKMHFSTCENQNCIQQGEVTLDNRESRLLGSLIVCLPNEVVLELVAPEEARVQEGLE